ncbi:MAG: nitroreductase family protein [Syntrophomonadaceae bacterium]|jgi:nitroreductase
MDTLECIKTRRSIRNFSDQPIHDNVLEELLEAVRWAPSWANTQCWELIVVKDPETKKQLAGLLAENNPATRAMTQAPVVIVTCARLGTSGFKKGQMLTDKGDWYMFDMGIAAQNLCLAAHNRGLGTVHVGSFNHAAVGQLLNVPEGVAVVELIPLGYPAKVGNAPPRKEIKDFVFSESYGNTINL